MCGEYYIYRRVRLDVENQQQGKRALGSGLADDKALLAVLQERERAFERLANSSWRYKRKNLS